MGSEWSQKKTHKKYNTDSESSSSGSISPAEDFSADPNYKCNIRVVDPRTVNTRQRKVSEQNKSEGTRQKRPPVYKSKTIQNLYLHPGDTAMATILWCPSIF